MQNVNLSNDGESQFYINLIFNITYYIYRWGTEKPGNVIITVYKA